MTDLREKIAAALQPMRDTVLRTEAGDNIAVADIIDALLPAQDGGRVDPAVNNPDLAVMRFALKQIVHHASNQDINHDQFRVHAYRCAESALENASAPPPEGGIREEQIKHMVQRFLMWKLPENFNPDNGISFKPTFNDDQPFGPMKRNPVGTNLFDADQAEAMVRFMLEGLPPLTPSAGGVSLGFTGEMDVAADKGAG